MEILVILIILALVVIITFQVAQHKNLKAKYKALKESKPSLMDFVARVKEVADAQNETYYSVKVNWSSQYTVKDPQLEISGYIHNNQHQTGGTIDEVCKKLIAHKSHTPIEQVVKDVAL